MQKDTISYQNSGYFSKIIIDYLDQKDSLSFCYHRFPNIENFKAQIEEKAQNYSTENRKILVSSVEKQYENFEISPETNLNIELLKSSKTFTITTGHQLNLFTGPLYFLYKIVSTINLCKQLKTQYPENDFVPIYWMATEDHDFEEINFFNLKNKKIRWQKDSKGPVGRLSTEGLIDVFEVFKNEIGIGTNAEYLKSLFEKSYLNHHNLADATRFLANELFSKNGLIIIDGDDIGLKKLFVPFIQRELLEQTSFKNVSETIAKLRDYPIQVNPREINLFYIENNIRERIVLENNLYKINNTKIEFTKNEMLDLVAKNPEKISPNVILRPLYQEVILPNLCYIGGGGELAYWFELKQNFETNQITFPILLLRNSALIINKKQTEKAEKLDLALKDLFLKQQNLFDQMTKKISDHKIDFSEQKQQLEVQFKKLYAVAQQTDKSFLGAVIAQEIKQKKGLDQLEKRLLKAEKKVHTDKLQRIILLQNELFPNQSLQERKLNFSEIYLESGTALLDKLFEVFNPLHQIFEVIEV